MRIALNILFILITLACLSQSSDSIPEDVSDEKVKEVFEIFSVENKAEFPGGDAAFSQYIGNNLEYPEDAVKDEVEGNVFIQFVVDTSGNIVNSQIMAVRLSGTDTTGYDYCMGQCALDVINKSPKWETGNSTRQKSKHAISNSNQV